MSTAVSTPTTASPELAAASETRARTTLCGLALAGSGIGIVVGHLLTVPSDQAVAPYIEQLAAHRTSSTIGTLLTAIGAFLVVPGLAAVLGMVRTRGSRLATIGAVLTGVSITALGAGDTMIALAMGGLIRDHRDIATRVFDISQTNELMGLPFVFAPVFVLGIVVIGVALLRARVLPVWMPVLLIVGVLLLPFNSAGGIGATLTLAPMGAALALIGWSAIRLAGGRSRS